MNNEELIKVKEDAIKIQVIDLQDTVKSIDNENIKSSFVLGFASVLFGLILNQINTFQLWQSIIFIILLILSVGMAFWNISAKKVNIHINVDEIFVKNQPKDWEIYLNDKYLRLRENYQNAKDLLYQKANYTRISFVLLVVSILFLVLVKII